MDHRTDSPEKSAAESPLLARSTAASLVAGGFIFAYAQLPWMLGPLTELQAGMQRVLVPDGGARGPIFGVMLSDIGLFGIWACRKPRSTDFKAISLALVVVFWPFVVFALPLPYLPICGWWLRLHGYERCDPAQVGKLLTSRGRGAVSVTQYGQLSQGGSAALPRPGSGLLPVPGPTVRP